VLWGWTPAEVIIPTTDPQGRTVYKVEREPEFDQEQYNLLAALEEYESGLGPHGLPLEETTSVLADPGNPNGTHYYVATVRRDWALDAVEQREKEFEKHPSRARIFSAERVDR
jgi:hypothetical protein